MSRYLNVEKVIAANGSGGAQVIVYDRGLHKVCPKPGTEPASEAETQYKAGMYISKKYYSVSVNFLNEASNYNN